MAHFERALKKLVEDANYRKAVINDHRRLTEDFKELDPHEMLLLVQVWQAVDHPAMNALTLCHCCCAHREVTSA